MDLEFKVSVPASNFVPEGEYRFRRCAEIYRTGRLRSRIHGLEHDGKLYSSKEKFAAKALRIREYPDNGMPPVFVLL